MCAPYFASVPRRDLNDYIAIKRRQRCFMRCKRQSNNPSVKQPSRSVAPE
jgi:hypothetical protein